MLIYTTCRHLDPPRDLHDIVTETSDEFLRLLSYRYGGTSVLCELQPGDGTLYRFSIVRDHDRVLLASTVGESFAVWLSAAGALNPEELTALLGRGVNPFTAAIACDLFRIFVRGGQGGCHYDWQRHRPCESGGPA